MKVSHSFTSVCRCSYIFQIAFQSCAAAGCSCVWSSGQAADSVVPGEAWRPELLSGLGSSPLFDAEFNPEHQNSGGPQEAEALREEHLRFSMLSRQDCYKEVGMICSHLNQHQYCYAFWCVISIHNTCFFCPQAQYQLYVVNHQRDVCESCQWPCVQFVVFSKPCYQLEHKKAEHCGLRCSVLHPPTQPCQSQTQDAVDLRTTGGDWRNSASSGQSLASQVSKMALLDQNTHYLYMFKIKSGFMFAKKYFYLYFNW